MLAVLLDFNGTMIFDSSLHTEAWSEVYRELFPEDTTPADASRFCGPCNDAIIRNLAPWLTPQERDRLSERKELLYRQACRNYPGGLHLVDGAGGFLRALRERGIPFGLASASIRSNIDFFFETFALGQWFRKDQVVYDDGTYPDKGAMHLEAARRLGTDFSQCLVVEDSPSSIKLAKRNGAGCIVAIGSTASPAELIQLGADYYIKDFSEFDLAWLDR